MSDPFLQERPSQLLGPPHSTTLAIVRDVISSEIAAIRWAEFTTAYNAPESVSEDLRFLLFGNEEQALDASHRLWCGLCHQHAYVSSAAEPAVPFLLLGLAEASDLIRLEILDIFLGFVVCRRPDVRFSMRVFERIKEQRKLIEALATPRNVEISEMVRAICKSIDEHIPKER